MSPQPPEEPGQYQISARPETVVQVLQSRYPEQAARCIAEAAALELQDLNRALQSKIDQMEATQTEGTGHAPDPPQE